MQGFRFQWAVSDAATKLIILNVFIFLAINIPLSLLHLFNTGPVESFLNDWLWLPGDPVKFITRPWTILTHMFMHSGIFHLLFNMITLYFSAQLFTRYFDDRRLLGVYFSGGLAGALFFMLAVNVFPLFTSMRGDYQAAGASAAALSILIAIAAYRPDDEVFLFGIIRMRLRWLAAIFIILDILQIRAGNAGGHIAHLGGALFGIVWARNLARGRDLAAWWNSLQDAISGKRKARMKVVHARGKSDEEYALSRTEKQRRLDEILDKISRSGYDSLSKQEKALLLELSKEN